MRRAARRDENERGIIDALRKLGYKVLQQSFPDLTVKNPRSGEVYLIEISGITKNRRRSKRQREQLAEWRIPVVASLDETLKLLGHL
jgi:hypothetical protein